MSSNLKGVEPEEIKATKPKILIFGKPGVGKTWTALDFPNVYYIDTEGGANLPHYVSKLKKSNGSYFGPKQGSLEFNTVIEQIEALATEKHRYKTVVIDSLSKIFNMEIAAAEEKLDKEGVKNAYGAHKKQAVKFTRRLIQWISKTDMNVILICHENALWETDAKGNRVETGRTFDAWDKLGYELHLCLNIVKPTPKSYLAKVYKSRKEEFENGTSFPWSYEEFSKRFGKEIIEGEVKQFVLAKPEQVNEINRLLNVVKVSDDWVEKTLRKANAENFSEVSEEQASKIISFLSSKFNPEKKD